MSNNEMPQQMMEFVMKPSPIDGQHLEFKTQIFLGSEEEAQEAGRNSLKLISAFLNGFQDDDDDEDE